MKIPTPVPIPFITCKVPSAPIHHVTPVRAFIPNFITETRVTSTPVQSLSTIRSVLPMPIITTSFASPMPTKLIYCMFTPDKVLTSLQSSSDFKRKRRFSIRKTKVSPPPMKSQFSGTCENKSRQMLHTKDRLVGTGWKKMREKRGSHQFVTKGSSRKSHHSVKSSSRKKRVSSLKVRKKSVRSSSRKKHIEEGKFQIASLHGKFITERFTERAWFQIPPPC